MADEIRNQIVLELMRLRGIETEEDIAEYLSDLPRRTYDPFLMKNMREATDLILAEAEAGSRICVYGDYDVDGITSVCILHAVLSQLTDNLTWHIPSRFTEGYGLHNETIDKLREDGVDLIITVDCGITSNREVAYAQSLGMRMVVTDHHQLGDVLPDCITIDPKQEDETYPFRDLAGCGVAYKLAQAIQRLAGLDRSAIVESLDLVASGTVADIVPLVDENRTIVKYGLNKLNERSRKGLAALEEAISLKTITSGSISYGIAPHLNAAGRMKNAGEAVRLLLAPEHDRATIRKQVETLIACNNQRKKLQDDAYRRSKEKITGEEAIICLRVDGIHEGIAGIAAGKLKEDFMRPVILATDTGDGILKGTGRSIDGVDLFSLLDGHRDLFARVGGHKRACGFTISEENFRTLQPLLEEEVGQIYEADPSILDQTGIYDLEIGAEDVSLELAEAIRVMEPFGEANEQPRFLVRGMQIRWPNYMGDSDRHVRFKAEKKGMRIPCVLFQKAQDYADQIESERPVDLIGTVEVNTWNDRKEVQMIVKEIL